jgi:hypothetical protein
MPRSPSSGEPTAGARNVEGGYWIAETDPAAAHHALTTTVDRNMIEWAVLATDGAADLIEHAGHRWHRWHRIAQYDDAQLAALLALREPWHQLLVDQPAAPSTTGEQSPTGRLPAWSARCSSPTAGPTTPIR